MPTLVTSDFNIVLAVLGAFVLLFGLVSYFVKERLYLSEALIALSVGVALGPQAANFIRPSRYASGSESELEAITLAFTRLVLGVQLVLAGVQLPKKYLLKEWRSLAMLLGPIMTAKWLVSSLLVWALIPHVSFLDALAFAACVTPTDPILANSIVKGKFADKHIPPSLQKIIIAESGANDGLGYPFLFLPLYLLKYVSLSAYSGGARHAVGLWFGETIGYQILLSVAYGAIVGWLAKDLLHWAEDKKLVDRESFLVFSIALALFIVGTCGMIGSDDVLACFIAGNVFTLDDWFRIQTADDSLQPTIDMLLNMTIFLWFGAVCPWLTFRDTPDVPLARVLGLGILIILLRRPPIIMLVHRFVPQIQSFRECLFAGYFGPIGVSAIFYLYVALEFYAGILKNPDLNSVDRERVERAKTAIVPVVWVCVIASVVVHGITVPMIQLGNAIPLSASTSFFPSLSISSRTRSRGKAPRLPVGLGTRIPVVISASTAAPPDTHEPSSPSSEDEDHQKQLKRERGEDLPRATKRAAIEPGLPTSEPASPTGSPRALRFGLPTTTSDTQDPPKRSGGATHAALAEGAGGVAMASGDGSGGGSSEAGSPDPQLLPPRDRTVKIADTPTKDKAERS